jgi:3-methyladenine DNA glycosylase AlkD
LSHIDKTLTANSVMSQLAAHASDADARHLQRFFKTGKGEYGEGDVFIGVRVPVTRRVVREYRELPLLEIELLLQSPVHEHRLAGALLLVEKYRRSDEPGRAAVYQLYRDALRQGYINNWDIVDVTCEYVVGEHLRGAEESELTSLAASANLWERRVAAISTFAYIKSGDGSTTLEIAELLLHDSHDLVQKAVGWMLREVGKRIDEQLLRSFLDQHAHEMPRTMLRYAIERLPEQVRRQYLSVGKSR